MHLAFRWVWEWLVRALGPDVIGYLAGGVVMAVSFGVALLVCRRRGER